QVAGAPVSGPVHGQPRGLQSRSADPVSTGLPVSAGQSDELPQPGAHRYRIQARRARAQQRGSEAAVRALQHAVSRRPVADSAAAAGPRGPRQQERDGLRRVLYYIRATAEFRQSRPEELAFQADLPKVGRLQDGDEILTKATDVFAHQVDARVGLEW